MSVKLAPTLGHIGPRWATAGPRSSTFRPRYANGNAFVHVQEEAPTSPAAHETAAVSAARRPVARSAVGAEHSRSRVVRTVIGTLVDVDQVFSGGQVVAAVLDLQLAAFVDLDFGGAVVFVFQVVADLVAIQTQSQNGHCTSECVC